MTIVCAKCNSRTGVSKTTYVTDKRGTFIRRRRYCHSCGAKSVTIEGDESYMTVMIDEKYNEMCRKFRDEEAMRSMHAQNTTVVPPSGEGGGDAPGVGEGPQHPVGLERSGLQPSHHSNIIPSYSEESGSTDERLLSIMGMTAPTSDKGEPGDGSST